MKKSIIISGLFLATLLLVTSCKKDLIMFDSSMDAVGFSSTLASVKEGATGDITVYFAAPAGTAGVTVNLAVSTEGIAKPAVEGTDYTLSAKTIDVPVGTAAVTITTIDNSIYEGNKKFYLTITSVSEGIITAQNTMTITVVDDEHPLKAWIGTYTVEALSYGWPGLYDETWTVTTSAIDGSTTKLSVVGIAKSSTAVVATLDKVAGTISFDGAQTLGSVEGGYAGGVLYYGTDPLIACLAGTQQPTDADLTAAAAIKITGTIDPDGTIHVDKMALKYVYSGTTYIWDVFNTTWAKN